jgi:hypothetical protein
MGLETFDGEGQTGFFIFEFPYIVSQKYIKNQRDATLGSIAN